MENQDYLKTIIVNGQDIRLYMDDYGQQYYIQWDKENGEIGEATFGSYNSDYMESTYFLFDDGYKKLYMAEMDRDLNEEELALMKKYKQIFEEEYCR